MDVLEICAKMIRNAVSTMSAKFSAHVKDEINTKVSSLYKPGGTATLATLPALTEENSGYVYDMSESFTTTANFREGAGHKYPAGTNVVVSDVGNGVYKYDVLSGMLDGYVQESRKVGNVPLSADIPVTLTGDSAITVTNTGAASAISYSIAHEDSGVTAGSKGDTTNQTPGFGGTFKALSVTVDAKGHVTALSDHTVKVPSDPATTSKDGLMSKSDKAKLDAIGVTASAPLEVTKTGETYNVTLKDSGVTAGSKGDTTNQTPGFGGTFKALSVTVDAKGRVTSLAEHTIEVPDTEATQSSAGLMSKEDKAKLDKVVPKGSASKGIYIDSDDNPVEMTYKLEADVPSGFATGTAAPEMDGTAAVGNSMKYAREDHIHPVDTSRASAVDVTALQAEIELLKELIRGIDAPIYRTASGNPATFHDGAAANVRELSVTLTPTQSGSGDPSPENIRPITGVSSVSVTRAGKNLFDAASGNVIIGYFAAGSNKTIQTEGNRQSRTAYIKCLPNTTYTVTHKVSAYEDRFAVGYTLEPPVLGDEVYGTIGGNSIASRTITTGPDARYLCVRFRSGYTDTPDTEVEQLAALQIEYGNAATAYEPYRGQTVTVSLIDSGNNPLTVYGGRLNVTTGTLSVTHKLLTLDGVTAGLKFITKSSNASTDQYIIQVDDGYLFGMDTGYVLEAKANEYYLLCSHYPYRTTLTAQSCFVAYIGSNGTKLQPRISFLRSEGVSTLAAANDWLNAQYQNGTPVEFLYPLAEPVTYQLTSQQLATLSGYNAVSTDADTLSVTYRADPSITFRGD